MSKAIDAPPRILVRIPLPPNHIDALLEKFAVVQDPLHLRDDRFWREAELIRGVLTNGSAGLSREDIMGLVSLEAVVCYGAGFENVDIAALRERHLVLANGAGANAACVAEHTFALLLSVTRNILANDAAVRAGRWKYDVPIPQSLRGKVVGILGLGRVGSEVAHVASSFGMSVIYCNRKPRSELPYSYEPNLLKLARDADTLVVCCPGGAGTRHLVDQQVISALKSSSVLVNVSRGSVVDTAALIDALNEGRLAGAALDVFEGEPHVSKPLLACRNLVLSPHIASRSPESADRMIQQAKQNFSLWFSARRLVTPVELNSLD